MTELDQELLDLLYSIKGAWKSSIGSINSHYSPQLQVKRVDELTARLYRRIAQRAGAGGDLPLDKSQEKEYHNGDD